MNLEKGNENPKGFETLLNQNKIAEKKTEANEKIESLEEKIRKSAPERSSSIVRNLRTLEGDVEESVSSGKTTLVSIASKQKPSELKTVVLKETIHIDKKKTFTYISIFIFIILGGTGVYYAYLLQKGPGVVSVPKDGSLIFVEKTQTLDTTDIQKTKSKDVLASLNEKISEQLGSIVRIIFTQKITSEEGVLTTKKLSIEDFNQIFSLGAPDRLTRSFEPEFLFGVHMFDGNQPFMLFTVRLYENAFPGMLEWEDVMEKNLGPIISKKEDLIKTAGGTTTPPVLTFEDITYKNMDLRVLKNEAGKILIVYSFPTQNTLIIARNPKTIEEVFTRLTTRRIVR